MLCGVVSPRTLRAYFSRLERMPLSKLEWPLGGPSGGDRVGDLSVDDHVILSATSRSMCVSRRNVRCRVSALIFEPPVIQGRWYGLLRLIGPFAFHRVFTHLPSLAAAIPNGRLVPHGGAMVRRHADESPSKQAMVSIVASRHNGLPGHKMRHRIIAWSRMQGVELRTFGTGYQPLEDKWDGHAPYRYSVVIENSRSPGYFTEKIIDSLLAWSIPIYWGDPEIGRVFLEDGMIACESEDDIKRCLRQLSIADFERRLPALEENQRRARRYASSMFERAARMLVEEKDASERGGGGRDWRTNC